MEARPTAHPSAESLRALALGKLDDNTASVVMKHLDSCPECSREVAASTNDDLLHRLRQTHNRTIAPAPAAPPGGSDRRPQPPMGPTTLWTVPPELADYPQYEVLRELGRGGMGVVYLGKNKLMDRLEVLKVLNKALLNHPGAVERFLREIRSAARLNHPNVVAAYSALQMGELLVFAMEYVDGEDLQALVKARGPLPVVHACHYVQQAAIGLQHAFEKGMIHRDIKPQNLILAREGKKHIIKVLDFGLAKVTRENSEDTALTGEGQMLGTVDYMPPEQTMDAAKADIRADIYSLGCTLYYLLTGGPPFTGKNLTAILLAHQSTEARSLSLIRPEVPVELSAVVKKMMAKTPAERYQTPAEVVKALATAGKLATKGTPKSSPAVPPPAAGRSEAEKKILRAQTILLPPSAAPATVQGRETTPGVARNLPPVEARQAGNAPQPRPATAWKMWLSGAAVGTVLLLGLLGLWATGVFKRKTKDGDSAPSATRAAEYDLTGGYRVVHFGADRTRVVLLFDSDKQYFARVYDAATGRAITPPLQHENHLSHASFSSDGRRVVTASDDKTARVWDATTGQAIAPPLKHEGKVRHASFSPDGQRVVTASWDKTARIWDAATGQEVSQPLTHEDWVRHASFSPDGTRVVTASDDKTARVWDAATGKELASFLQHESNVYHASFRGDGRSVVTASNDKTARVWDAATGKEIAPPLKHEDRVDYASFTPDGQRVVTASNDKTARVWDAATGQAITPPLQHEDGVRFATFSADGQRVVTASEDKTARLWDAATGKEVTPFLRHNGAVTQASFSPHRSRVITAGADNTARLWDAATGEELKKATIAPD